VILVLKKEAFVAGNVQSEPLEAILGTEWKPKELK
jgi:hypothetical protein